MGNSSVSRQKLLGSSMPSSFQNGEVDISQDLREMANIDWSAVVSRLTIYESEMKGAHSLNPFRHHFLVLEMVDLHRAEVPPRKGPYHIRADKTTGNVKERGSKAKITIKPTMFEIPVANVRFEAVEIDLRIPIAKILDILSKPSPDYDVLSSNCWSYVHEAGNGLFNALEELHPTQKHKLDGIRKEIPDLLISNETIVPFVAATSVGAAFVRSRPDLVMFPNLLMPNETIGALVAAASVVAAFVRSRPELVIHNEAIGAAAAVTVGAAFVRSLPDLVMHDEAIGAGAAAATVVPHS